MYERSRRIIRFCFVDVVEIVLFCLMVALCVDIFVGVFSRYVMSEAFSWYDEVARYLFIWVVFLGAAVGVRRRAHFAVHLLVAHLGKGARFATELLCWGVVMGFSVLIGIQGLRVMEGVSVQVSPTLWNMNLSWVFLVIPIHGVLSFLYSSVHVWETLKVKGKEDKP
jgi:TRAP-type C4-dicarboxylate transport system permease small subunit